MPNPNHLAMRAISVPTKVTANFPAGFNPRIMCTGDSITAGYTDNPTWSVPFSYGFRDGLYDLLMATHAGHFTFVGASAEPWNAVFGDPNVNPSTSHRLTDLGVDHHRGYGGYYVNQIGNNLPAWAAADTPDIILFMAGINNLTPGQSGEPTGTEDQLRAAMVDLFAARPTQRVIIAQITPYLTVTPSLNAYNTWIRDVYVPELVTAGRSVTTVDMYAAMMNGASVPDSAMYSNAYNHPSPAAYARMATAAYNALLSHLGAIAGTY